MPSRRVQSTQLREMLASLASREQSYALRSALRAYPRALEDATRLNMQRHGTSRPLANRDRQRVRERFGAEGALRVALRREELAGLPARGDMERVARLAIGRQRAQLVG